MSFNLLSIIGLVELEAGISASVLKPLGKKTKPKARILKSMIKPPVCREVDLMMKYKVKQTELHPISSQFYKHIHYSLWLRRPSKRSVNKRSVNRRSL